MKMDEYDGEGDDEEGVSDDGVEDGREVAGAVPRGEEALARLLPWRTVSMYTTRFVEMPLNAVLLIVQFCCQDLFKTFSKLDKLDFRQK
jgi:hypothetical protein